MPRTVQSIQHSQHDTARWSAVPIENIYYLLCYAWDALEEGDTIDVAPEQSLTIVDLFARVLIRGTRHLLARGVDLDYREQHGPIAGIHGKLDVGATVKGMTWTRSHTVCTVAERSADIPHNQILKATLRRLATLQSLAPSLANDADELARRMPGVSTCALTSASFHRVRVRRNNRMYDLLMHVCRLIANNPFLEAHPGDATFPDFIGGRAEMARLFETFVYHFYAREQEEFTVRRPVIAWHAAEVHRSSERADDNTANNAMAHDDGLQMLPVMRTDVMLTERRRIRHPRRIIIDTKYYERSFQHYRGAVKIRSPHLYQLIAYLKNVAAADVPDTPPPEGMLLYPVVDAPFHQSYTLLGHRVTVRSVDLGRPWRYIHQELLQAIDSSL